MAPSGLLFLGLLLSSSGALPPPRTSFILNFQLCTSEPLPETSKTLRCQEQEVMVADSTERPLVHFSLSDVQNTTTLLLSNDGATLYIGAQDAILSLDVSQSDVISLKNKVSWRPTEAEISSCGQKVQNPEVDCMNLVHVVQPINSTHLYVCGSYAYSPRHAFIDIGSFSLVHQGGAKGRCPFSPFERSSAVTIDGELFTASTSTFRGNEPQISRYFSRNQRPDVSLDSSTGLLEEPKFVSSSFDPEQQKLYFFFTEVGKEFSFVNKLQIARVAQVCKDDVGGQRILQKKWTSFAKTILLCQKPKQLPFNVLQDMFTLQPPEGSRASETQFYGIFTSQWSAQAESAVCMFRLQDIRAVFSGPYRTMETLQWSSVRRSFLGKCGLANYSDSDLSEVKKSFLTSDRVNPVGQTLVSSEQRYSRVAVMRTQAANGQQYNILFLLTENGFLHKVVLFDQGPRVLEEIQVFTEPQRVKSMVLSSSRGILYVGTSAGVTAVPVARCSVYRSCSRCVLARDPLCGWSQTRKVCTGLVSGQEDVVQNLENSNVEDECQEEQKVTEVTEVKVHLKEAVKLPCVKPSNLASLTWTSSLTTSLPERLFIHSADGSLSFLASSGTFGRYSCEAEEAGFREVVVSYNVRLIPSPRHLPRADESVSKSPEEVFEDIETQEPTQASGSPEGSMTNKVTSSKGDSRKENTEDPGDHVRTAKRGGVSTQTKSIRGGSESSNRVEVIPNRSMLQPSDAPRQKSYYSEMVVVSLLLAACICVLLLGFLHLHRQKKPDHRSAHLVALEGCSKANTSIEISSLSSPEDAGPDQTDAQ